MTVKEKFFPPGTLDPENDADYSRRASRLHPLHRSEIRPVDESEWLCRAFFFGESENEDIVVSVSASKGVVASEARYFGDPASSEAERLTRRLSPEESSVFQDLLARNEPCDLECVPELDSPPFMVIEYIKPARYACLVSGFPRLGCPEYEIARALCSFWPELAGGFLERLER